MCSILRSSGVEPVANAVIADARRCAAGGALSVALQKVPVLPRSSEGASTSFRCSKALPVADLPVPSLPGLYSAVFGRDQDF